MVDHGVTPLQLEQIGLAKELIILCLSAPSDPSFMARKGSHGDLMFNESATSHPTVAKLTEIHSPVPGSNPTCLPVSTLEQFSSSFSNVSIPEPDYILPPNSIPQDNSYKSQDNSYKSRDNSYRSQNYTPQQDYIPKSHTVPPTNHQTFSVDRNRPKSPDFFKKKKSKKQKAKKFIRERPSVYIFTISDDEDDGHDRGFASDAQMNDMKHSALSSKERLRNRLELAEKEIEMLRLKHRMAQLARKKDDLKAQSSNDSLVSFVSADDVHDENSPDFVLNPESESHTSSSTSIIQRAKLIVQKQSALDELQSLSLHIKSLEMRLEESRFKYTQVESLANSLTAKIAACDTVNE